MTMNVDGENMLVKLSLYLPLILFILFNVCFLFFCTQAAHEELHFDCKPTVPGYSVVQSASDWLHWQQLGRGHQCCNRWAFKINFFPYILKTVISTLETLLQSVIGCSVLLSVEKYMKKLFGTNKDRMGVDQKAVLLVSKVNESKRHGVWTFL